MDVRVDVITDAAPVNFFDESDLEDDTEDTSGDAMTVDDTPKPKKGKATKSKGDPKPVGPPFVVKVHTMNENPVRYCRILRLGRTEGCIVCAVPGDQY